MLDKNERKYWITKIKSLKITLNSLETISHGDSKIKVLFKLLKQLKCVAKNIIIDLFTFSA
jgi:hypothetical protein